MVFHLVNARFQELFAGPGRQVIGKTDLEIFPAPFAARFRQNDLVVLETGQPFQVEEAVPQAGGEHTYLSVKFPVQDEQGKVSRLWGISVNITDLKMAQDKLRRLSGSIMASQEQERTAIARELHDELGQVLTALRMEAVWLHGRLGQSDPQGAARALDMCELIDRTITEVRGISTRLRPAVLDDLGLVDALEWHAADFEKRTGIACDFSHGTVPQVREYIAIAAYRVAQEALTNVARHARAERADVSLRVGDGRLILTVEDDGQGFDPQVVGEPEGWGLAGMYERASLAAGSLEIDSSPGRGTRVVLTLPLEG